MLTRIRSHHTVSFAVGHLARGAVVATVGLLYGISTEADAIFLAYYVVGLPIGVVALTVQFSISHMRSVKQVAPWMMAIGTFLLLVTTTAVYRVTGHPLVLYMAPYGILALGGLLLYGTNAAHGNLRLIPVAQVVGAVVLLSTALATRHLGPNGIVWALITGELTYSVILLRGLRGQSRVGEQELWATQGRELMVQLLRQLPKGLTLGLAVPSIRLAGGFFGDGWISIFTYVSVAVVTGFVILTAGYRATMGARRASSK